jgi:8-oxo-dGTP pyrophosphatase MutT (NUDIX family)
MTDAPPKAPAPARPASTVVILRDAPGGTEVFMVVRHKAIDFASGALVFPGGKVDPQDASEDWRHLAAPIGATGAERALRVAAGRETFEEAGLLLARRRDATALVSAADAHRLVAAARADVLYGARTFASVLAAEGLVLAADLLVPFAHWITPDPVPKRFDTHFFLVAAPVQQLGAHDGAESTEGIWIRPQQALDDAGAGKRTLVLATAMNLRKLARFATVADTVAAARVSPVVTVKPRVEMTPEGRKVHIPAEAGYGVTEVYFANASVPGH